MLLSTFIQNASVHKIFSCLWLKMECGDIEQCSNSKVQKKNTTQEQKNTDLKKKMELVSGAIKEWASFANWSHLSC